MFPLALHSTLTRVVCGPFLPLLWSSIVVHYSQSGTYMYAIPFCVCIILTGIHLRPPGEFDGPPPLKWLHVPLLWSLARVRCSRSLNPRRLSHGRVVVAFETMCIAFVYNLLPGRVHGKGRIM